MANKIINSLSTSNTDANISIDFEMSIARQDSINNKLIEYAIIDARKKADIIAKSTDQIIVKIDKINYGVEEGYNNVVENTLYSLDADSKDDAMKSFTITPQQVEKGTQIVIYYQLRKK